MAVGLLSAALSCPRPASVSEAQFNASATVMPPCVDCGSGPISVCTKLISHVTSNL